MSDSVRPHRWQPTRLPRPWDSSSKNTGVGFHFLLQCMKVKSESEVACSVVSDSSQPHGLQPTRFLRSWDFPGKSTGVGCHCLLRRTKKYFCKILGRKSLVKHFALDSLYVPGMGNMKMTETLFLTKTSSHIEKVKHAK